VSVLSYVTRPWPYTKYAAFSYYYYEAESLDIASLSALLLCLWNSCRWRWLHFPRDSRDATKLSLVSMFYLVSVHKTSIMPTQVDLSAYRIPSVTLQTSQNGQGSYSNSYRGTERHYSK